MICSVAFPKIIAGGIEVTFHCNSLFTSKKKGSKYSKADLMRPEDLEDLVLVF